MAIIKGTQKDGGHRAKKKKRGRDISLAKGLFIYVNAIAGKKGKK